MYLQCTLFLVSVRSRPLFFTVIRGFIREIAPHPTLLPWSQGFHRTGSEGKSPTVMVYKILTKHFSGEAVLTGMEGAKNLSHRALDTSENPTEVLILSPGCPEHKHNLGWTFSLVLSI